MRLWRSSIALLTLVACVACEPPRPTFTCLEARQRLLDAPVGQALCVSVEPDEMVATESTLTFCEWGFSLVAPPVRDRVRLTASRGGEICFRDLVYLTDSTSRMAVIVSAEPR